MNSWGIPGPLRPGTVIPTRDGRWTYTFQDSTGRKFMQTINGPYDSAANAKKAMREFCGVPLP